MNVNDKVVCIESVPKNELRKEHYIYHKGSDTIHVNKVYVINKIISYPHWGNIIGLGLVGHSCRCPQTGCEVGYDSRMFRKLDEVKEQNKNKQIDLIGAEYQDINPS